MSRRALTWTLWLLAVATVPLPYFMIDSGRVPAAQLFLLAAVTTPLMVTDPSYTTRFIASLFIAQSLLSALALYLLARLAAGAIARWTEPRQRGLAVAVIAVALIALALCSVYRAPLSHGPGATNLLGVFR
jgi:hypothetical protein